MRLTLSSFIVVGTAAIVFAGCSSTDDNPGNGTAGSGGRSAAGAPASAGAGTGGSIANGGSGVGGSIAGSGVGGSSDVAGGGGSGGTVGVGGGSAGSSAGGGTTKPATFETVKLVVDGGGCDAAPCHGKGGAAPPSNHLTLPRSDDTVLYASLTTYMSKGCGNIPLVKKGDGEGSALVKILKGTCPAPTMRMPLDCNPDPDAGNCIPPDYIAAISKWITDGAVQ